MAEFMEVGEADLDTVGGLIAFGLIPDVFQKKQDLGRERRGFPTEFAAMLIADEQAQDVRFQAFGLEGGVGERLVANWDGFGGRPDVGGQAFFGGGDDLLGEGGEADEVHGALLGESDVVQSRETRARPYREYSFPSLNHTCQLGGSGSQLPLDSRLHRTG